MSDRTDAATLPEALRPAIEKYRDEADETRRIPAQLLDQLRAAGAFRLNAPRESGGFELPLASVLELYERLGRIDGPVAWVIWNLNWGFSAAFLPESGFARIGPDALIANSGQPGRLVHDGADYRLSGAWRIVSGVESADWVALAAIVFDGDRPKLTDAGPDVRIVWVPRSAVTVRDTWDVVGMRGTNSDTVVAEDLAVPADLVVPFAVPPRIDRPAYRVPLVHLVFPGCAAVVLGVARAAVDEVTALAGRKVGMDGVPLAEQPRLQAALGRATAEVGAARALLFECARGLDRAAEAGAPATDAQRGELRGAISYAAETARSVLTAMYEAGSSDPLYASSRLGRIFRDGMAAAQHANMSAAHYELAGRTRLGLPPNALIV
ncbi:acyl-CoA dehydrogenase family protein [Asanoa iriomotensis]|uniref:Acyl-CoA dehydrogenase n=1 Tax=Asanoa iriomotensis TaxID=234613 RepID=A0ABQ4BVG5_9ACTN|nr:acyl-CoA dehydrogenase family protein [Asanoa iriomotensis]GIF54507.1 acyl-CoA dehydrogenase [Asanoa iriomotensis]